MEKERCRPADNKIPAGARGGRTGDPHFPSRMLTLAACLMLLAGVLMAVCVHLSVGGMFWAAAACLFFAARGFRLRENQKGEDSKEEET